MMLLILTSDCIKLKSISFTEESKAKILKYDILKIVKFKIIELV